MGKVERQFHLPNEDFGRPDDTTTRLENDLEPRRHAMTDFSHMENHRALAFGVHLDDRTVQLRLSALRDALQRIFANKMHTLSFCDLYLMVYTLTNSRHGPSVHALVEEAVAEHARAVDSLDALDAFWTSVYATRDVCMYLYRTTLKSQSVEGIAEEQLSLRKSRALQHLRRIAPRVGRLRLQLQQLHAHVHYKPNGRGEASAKADFESVAQACVWYDSNRQQRATWQSAGG